MNYGKLEGICFASIMGQMPDGRLDRPGPVGALEVWIRLQRLMI